MKAECHKKRIKRTTGNSGYDEVSTSGLSILARIIAKYHLIQLGIEQSVHPTVPRGQVGGHIEEEDVHE